MRTIVFLEVLFEQGFDVAEIGIYVWRATVDSRVMYIVDLRGTVISRLGFLERQVVAATYIEDPPDSTPQGLATRCEDCM